MMKERYRQLKTWSWRWFGAIDRRVRTFLNRRAAGPSTESVATTVEANIAAAVVEASLVETAAEPERQNIVEHQKTESTSRGGRSASEQIRWHLRSTILDRLDDYFGCMRRVKKYDPDAYSLYSRVGLAVPADRWFKGESTNNIERFTREERPSFGGVLVPETEDPTRISPSFLYFSKVRRPFTVEHFDGEIFRLTAMMDDQRQPRRWKTSLTMPLTCHVGIDGDGQIKVLRELTSQSERIEPGRKRKHGRKPKPITLSSTTLRVPVWVKEYEAQQTRPVASLLVMAMLTYRDAVGEIVIRANRGDCCAAFGIHLDRAKYFFADRDIQAAADGKRKRIFHAVAGHDRKLPNGSVVQVRDHYRGARTFDWKSYQIGIVLPDNARMLAFDQPGTYEVEIDEKDRPSYLTESEFGQKVAEVLSA